MSQQAAVLYTAQYVVNTASVYGPVTPMKLQKLLYYVKAWGLLEDETLVEGPFEKWPYGPVNPDVYRIFKSYGSSPIPHKPVLGGHQPSGRTKTLIDFIALSYTPFSPLALSKMTHEENPWKNANMGEVITEQAMRAYYQQHPFSANFPFDPAQPYVAVPSNAGSAYTLDMSRRDAERTKRFDSYDAYLHQLEWLRRSQPGAHDLFNSLVR